MNNIKSAFDSVHASGELKGKTLAFISERSRHYTKKKTANYLKIIPAAAVIIAAFFGIKLYLTPTTHINIDINPSLDLGINLFDRVVSVKALNDDGERLLNDLDPRSLKFAAYDEALRRILDNKSVESLLLDNEILSVTVIETNSAQSANILSGARECASGYGNVHCHSASSEQASEASELGLSYEKYLAYLNLSAVDPEITPEMIRNMTMREIRDLTAQLTGNGVQFNDHDNNHNEHENYSSSDIGNYSIPTETGHHGNGNGHGHGHG